MAYRYRRRHGSSRWAQRHVSQRQALTHRFGGVDQEIEQQFFALPPRELATMFHRYGAKYGAVAESYARQTYSGWKSGAVKMSGQTAERLLDLVPPLLSPPVRFDLIKKLRAHHLGVERIYLSVGFDNWRSAVTPAVEKIVERSRNANLPADVTRVASWLTHDDAKSAQALLVRAEQEDAKIRTSVLDEEMRRIAVLAEHFSGKQASFSHLIRIPNGEIQLHVEAPKRRLSAIQWLSKGLNMSEEQKPQTAIDRIGGSPALAKRPDTNLLDVAVAGLSEKDVQQLRGRAVEEKLRLDVSAREADHRFVNAARDMGATVRLAQELDHGRNDYNVDGTYETASGRTTVHIKKSTNQAFLIVAIVIGVLALLAVMSR